MRVKFALLAVALAVLAQPLTARADISAEQARASIERAVSYLKRQQKTDGSWPD